MPHPPSFRHQRFTPSQADTLLEVVRSNPRLLSLNLTDVVIEFSVRLKLHRFLERRGGDGLVLAPSDLCVV